MTTSQRPVREVPWYDRRTFRHVREAAEAYLFLLPGTFLLLAFNLIPIGYALYISLHSWRIRKGPFVGLENIPRPWAHLSISSTWSGGSSVWAPRGWSGARFRQRHRRASLS